MTAIETHGLATGYSFPLYNGLDLTLQQGELVCLLGLNGAGKSTLLKTLCGFLKPLGGELKIMGNTIDDIHPERLSRTIGMVLTGNFGPGGVTVRELVSMGRYPHTGFFGKLSPDDRKAVERAIASAGIPALADRHLGEISDGERQKAFIAKALAQECPIIILDEPTAFLDVTSRMEMMVLLRHLADRENKAVLVSTHDLDSALQTAHTLWLMEKGEGSNGTVRCGSPIKLAEDGSLSAFFSRGPIKFDTSSGRLTVSL